jgi:hypothetical protein
MSQSAKDHDAPLAHASAFAITDARRARTRTLFAPNDALEKLLPPPTARRFAELRSSLRQANARSASCRVELQRHSLPGAATRLTEATMYYERHVLAWLALGRLGDVRSAREAIAQYQRAVAAEPSPAPSRHTGQGAARSRDLQHA